MIEKHHYSSIKAKNVGFDVWGNTLQVEVFLMNIPGIWDGIVPKPFEIEVDSLMLTGFWIGIVI